jgi:RNA polymerase sigma factor (sigma-70 family)
VDEDPAACAALAAMLAGCGYVVRTFHDAETFLQQHDDEAHGCVVVDHALCDHGGTPVLQRLCDREFHMPVIATATRAEHTTIVRVMKCGAFDFLLRPIDPQTLPAAVASAVASDRIFATARQRRMATDSLLATLTPREREVLTHLLAGRLNKQIAASIGTSEKTVKVHRSRVMEKMQVRSAVQLAHLVEGGDAAPGRPSIRSRAGTR